MPFTEAMVPVSARDHRNVSNNAMLKTLNEARMPRNSTMLSRQRATMT